MKAGYARVQIDGQWIRWKEVEQKLVLVEKGAPEDDETREGGGSRRQEDGNKGKKKLGSANFESQAKK